jgi:phage gp46-like protein
VAVAVLPISNGAEGDVSYDSSGKIVEGQDLKGAVYCSLFWNAPALPGDDVPENATRQGFWADALDPELGVTGSRLWLLERAKVTTQTISDAKTYAEEALSWMVTDGVARSVLVETSRFDVGPGTAGILTEITIFRPDGKSFTWAWDALTGEEA